jgi:hypothetical protein
MNPAAIPTCLSLPGLTGQSSNLFSLPVFGEGWGRAKANHPCAA